MEEWIKINGFDNYYISNYGKVYSTVKQKIYGISYSSLNKYRQVKEFRILPKTQTTISEESTPEDKLLVEVPTTLTS